MAHPETEAGVAQPGLRVVGEVVHDADEDAVWHAPCLLQGSADAVGNKNVQERATSPEENQKNIGNSNENSTYTRKTADTEKKTMRWADAITDDPTDDRGNLIGLTIAYNYEENR